MDSILISVTPEEAKAINLIREITTFNITGLNNDANFKQNDCKEEQQEIQNDQRNISGEGKNDEDLFN